MTGRSLLPALDPRRSAVVEACAGSGKTWLLVSRLIRLLLQGVPPGRILAISFTRKAAREIEERLGQWLRLLASAPDAEALDFLCQRGLDGAEAQAALPRARGLLEQVLQASPPATITTFHGWFARLVQGAPLASGLGGYTLVETPARLLDEAWTLFARRCGRDPEGAEARSLHWLLARLGLRNTRQLLRDFAQRRAEWHALLEEAGGLPGFLEMLRQELGVSDPPDALQRCFAQGPLQAGLAEYGGFLARSELAGDRALAADLDAALTRGRQGPSREAFEALRRVLFTEKGALRARKPGKALDKRFGAPGAARFLQLHAELGAALDALQALLQEEDNFLFNCHGFTAGAGLLRVLEDFKAERRLMDFADLEWHADRLLQDEHEAAFLQARLDARYAQVLLDEFQDTNPLQWRILRAWFDAYGPGIERPGVFVVGDPKQSIYRFRRAEPRIFAAAKDYFAGRFGALLLENDATRRNAPALVEVVNTLFGTEPAFAGFRPQVTVQAGLPGRVEVLPLFASGDETAQAPGQGALRDCLSVPRVLAEDLRRAREAETLAARIAAMVGRVEVVVDGQRRPADYGDVLILCRRRTRLAEYERALRQAGIPYLSVSRGGLLYTLEAADVGALLRFLSSPADDLALAHALRAPFFAVADADLVALARRPEPGWWERLRAAPAPSAALVRARHLLEGWLALASRLPVHDLLDRIYAESDLPARYRAQVAPAAWPGVQANLEAFMALALQLDAGRYPSLPRFVDELARLGQAGDEEAPDEGVISAAAEGRVRILTIHGAKGLEAPIVWLIDAHGVPPPGEAWQVLLDWPPEADRPRHLSLLGRKAERGQARRLLLEAEARAAEREELNLLYVALTRAAQWLLVSGIAPARGISQPTAYDRVAAALAGLGALEGVFGGGLPAALPSAPQVAPAPLAPLQLAGPVGERLPESGAAQAWGVALHALLERAAPAEGERPPALPAPDAALQAAARGILGAAHLRPFFDPRAYRRALNEVDVVLADGAVGRIDRLVEFDDGWWVLDYKSGPAPVRIPEAYQRQLEGYRAALAPLAAPRPVRCALIYGDAGLLELR